MDSQELFLAENTLDGGFLQSSYWQRLCELEKKPTHFFCEKNKVSALAVENKLPLAGSYWFTPRGPVFANDHLAAENLLNNIAQRSRQNQIGWLRVEPQKKTDLELIRKFAQKNKFKLLKTKKDHQPAQTLMLDLTQKEEDILAQMKSKTRYNLRLAQRKGIEIVQSQKLSDIEQFLKLLKITAQRDGIVNHSDEHYRNFFRLGNERVKLFLAKDGEEVLAGALVTFYGQVATYLHGASGNQKRNKMPTFLLHWEIIRFAKQQGMKKYDWGGTKLEAVEKGDKITYQAADTAWAGISRFKLGFCPNQKPVDFVGCYDLVFSPFRYSIYRLLQIAVELKKKLKKVFFRLK